jgi:hypothetical protein
MLYHTKTCQSLNCLLQNLYRSCLTHELIEAHLPFGFVCLNKLIRKTRGIYNTYIKGNMNNTPYMIAFHFFSATYHKKREGG